MEKDITISRCFFLLQTIKNDENEFTVKNIMHTCLWLRSREQAFGQETKSNMRSISVIDVYTKY